MMGKVILGVGGFGSVRVLRRIRGENFFLFVGGKDWEGLGSVGEGGEDIGWEGREEAVGAAQGADRS